MGAKQAVAMPPELPAALADVRSDASSTDWCLCGFEGAALRLQPYVLEAATLYNQPATLCA